MSCTAETTPDSLWNFCPSVGAAALFIVLFGILAIAHISQAIYHRKTYSIVLIISALLQFVTYILRIISIKNPAESSPYIGWFVLILVAPIFTNAYVYMVFGRMVFNFIPNQRLLKTKPWRFGTYFVMLDIIAFFIQVVGAATAASSSSKSGSSASSGQTGLYVYMGGVAFQQLFILVFVSIAIRFQLRVSRENTVQEQKARGLRLLYVLYIVLALITTRIIFRLVEYSDGVQSSITDDEVYMYVFDTAPMWIAILLFNIFHPGRFMPGKESEWGSRKERNNLLPPQKLSNGFDSSPDRSSAMHGQVEMV